MDIQMLQNIRNTLNRVEVHGKENMDMLLGCIMTLDNAIATDRQQALQAAQAETEGDANDDHNERGGDA